MRGNRAAQDIAFVGTIKSVFVHVIHRDLDRSVSRRWLRGIQDRLGPKSRVCLFKCSCVGDKF